MLIDRLHLGVWAANIINRFGISLIEAPDYQGWLWAIGSNVPRILRIHGADILFSPILGRKLDKWKAYFEVGGFRKADYIIASSRFIGEKAVEYLGNGCKISTIIYNMVDVDLFKPSPQKYRDPFRVASVSTLARHKGVYQLLEAWRIVQPSHPHAHLSFYGRDSKDPDLGINTLERLKELTANYGLESSVSFMGAIPHKDIADIFLKEGIIVFPSYVEAHPRAWLEAMSSEAPIIGSCLGPGKEVIMDGETGLLINPDAINILADRVCTLLDNPQYASELGKSARKQMVGNNSIPIILEQNINFYNDCLHKV
jgi:glycosyltransferase involved in cell wall biosynthesis